MGMLKVMLLSLLLAALGLPSAHAGQASDDSPEAVVTAMNQAMREGDWHAAVRWFDPQALQEFRTMLMSTVDAAPKSQREMMIQMLFGADSSDTLKARDDAAFLVGFLGGALAMSGGRLEDSRIIGSVAEGEALRHVVIRSTTSTQGVKITKMDVISLRRKPEGWRVLLKGEMTGMAEALARRMRGAAKLED